MGIKDGDLGEHFPSNSNGSFFVTRKCDGIELYQPQNATKFSIFFLEQSLALVTTQMFQKISFVSVKVGERE